MKKIIYTICALVAGLAAGLTVGIMTSSPSGPAAATLFNAARELPYLELVDHNGRAVTSGIFQEQWDLLFFGFTRCPDICPATLGHLRKLRDDLPRQRQPRIWMVSVDPEYDTPEKLHDYVGFFGPDIHGVTGTTAEITKLAAALGVAYTRVPQADDYTISHSAALFLVDPDGNYAGVFNTPHQWDQVGADLKWLLR